ncbi:MAG: DUF4270 domain-containing protein [Algibacter sp.]|uniref:DUF4270 domain-containing protein n=1 Tax=Algibacter sp. TaxID=1872428 RepID=UPI00262339F9|nr:DUF4270 domain-containing protein [Algibacter sp.]MDG1730798.1 DUF4270 domain-containing protein [Algibacter sp.]MDG2177504.1 DUF4270 domain-containing protein [Algibacter sp.]
MKKTFKALKFPIVFLLLISFIACDKDFNTIDSDVLGEGNASFLTDSLELPIVVYNKKLDSLQINNLSANLLGVFNDPDFGKTTASIVTQITPNAASLTENFGVNPVIDSVVINIPYFSTITGVDSNNSNIQTYALDSLYGNNSAPVKLSIYQNNYFLRDFDPSGNVSSVQNYYSKTEVLDDATRNYALNGSQQIDFDNHLGELIYENNNFTNNSEAIELWNITSTDTTITYAAPALRICFDGEVDDDADEIEFWQQTIVAKNGSPDISSANNFKNYFRGLYFKTEAIDNDGNMILMNLASTGANITIYYSKGEEGTRIQDSYVLNFTGNRLNVFKNEFFAPLINGNKDEGDETLYLKGLEGSMAVVDLFPTEEALENFKNQFLDANGNQKALINEAYLIVFEDDDMLTNPIDQNGNSYHKYDRIFAYDIKNNSVTIDYLNDFTENQTNPLISKILHLGQREESGKYKIRITEYLNNIIQNNSTNYQIGLVLSNNVNVTSSSEILNSNDDVTAVPMASIISPRGTILHGSNSLTVEKQLKFKVFFTKSKAN